MAGKRWHEHTCQTGKKNEKINFLKGSFYA